MSFGPWRYVIFGIIIVLLGWGIYDVMVEKGNFGGSADELRAELGALDEENTALESDISYFENPENLVKALKLQFHYRAPDEKLIILVPGTESTSSATGTGN